jgi:hypothetical protein
MLSLRMARLRAWLALLPLGTLAVTVSLAISPQAAGADAVRDDQLWVLDALHAQEAWPVSEGKGVTVAVIDSGVNPGVSDLTGSVRAGPDLTGVGTSPSDPDWGMHGTWMASLIAGHGDGGGNGSIGADGIVGVAPDARVLSIRVITDQQDPGYARYQHEPQTRVQRELADAIAYAVAHHVAVISMSLGYGRPSLAVRQALQIAFDHGVVVVASSGNSGAAAAAHGRSAPYSFPADYPGVLGVAAVKMDGSPAGFSSDNLSVQIAAPGVKVPAQGTDGKYWLVSGTSPACALTAGVAALIKSKYPALSPSLVRQAITTTATNAPAGNYDAQVGFGTVDAPAALAAAGHLAIQARQRHRRLPKRSVQPDGYFGGGPSAAPHAPIGRRGPGSLILFCLLGLACLVAVVFATSRLATIRRQPPAAGGAPAAGGLPAGEGPATGYDGASGYERGSGYDGASGYERGSGYDGASGYERGSGYDRSSRHGPATADELADQRSAPDQAPDDAQHGSRRPPLWLPPGHEGRHAAAPHRPSVAWPPE